MTKKEAIKELEWVKERGFVADLGVIGTDRIVEAMSMAIESISEQKECEMSIEAIHSPSKLLKMSNIINAKVVEQRCSNCKKYNVKWEDTNQYKYCPMCGSKVI